MGTWAPITADELKSLIDRELSECTQEQRALFARYCVEPYLAPLERYGKSESVYVVALRDNEVMYYEDIDEGFNFSPLTEDGQIAEHWCNQDELKHALHRWLDGERRKQCGPATRPTF